MDGWRILTAPPSDIPIWEQLVHKVAHERHARDRSRAQLIANAVWGRG